MSEISTVPKLLPMPADGEAFPLTLDADNADLFGMVRACGRNIEGWKYTGKKLQGTHTHRFMWVAVGPQNNIDAVRAALKKHGRVPEGQWLVPMRSTYEHDDHWRGVADPFWRRPPGFFFFPYVDVYGRMRFCRNINGGSDDWRWLVKLSK